MKRVIAVSDVHGDVQSLRDALDMARRVGRIDVVVFLGDGSTEFEQVRPQLMQEGVTCYSVAGNNDWSSRDPQEIVFMVGKVRFYACHGHTRHVKFGVERVFYAAQEREAQVALYGHTHRAKSELERGIHLINPGAVCEHFHRAAAYADIRVEDNGAVLPTLVQWP